MADEGLGTNFVGSGGAPQPWDFAGWLQRLYAGQSGPGVPQLPEQVATPPGVPRITVTPQAQPQPQQPPQPQPEQIQRAWADINKQSTGDQLAALATSNQEADRIGGGASMRSFTPRPSTQMTEALQTGVRALGADKHVAAHVGEAASGILQNLTPVGIATGLADIADIYGARPDQYSTFDKIMAAPAAIPAGKGLKAVMNAASRAGEQQAVKDAMRGLTTSKREMSKGYQPSEQRAVERMAGEGPAPEPRVPVPDAPETLQEAVTGARNSFKQKKGGAIAQSGLREMSLPDAINEVRQGKHLQAFEPDGSFVGGPMHIKTPEQLDAMRRDFDESVRIGSTIGGEKWYDQGRGVVNELTRGDPIQGRFLAGSLGVTSAQATPRTNLGFELQGHNSWEMGEPRSIVRTGAQAKNLNEARDLGTYPKTGLKTGVYKVNLDSSTPWSTTGTNDIWHARALGYRHADGKPWDKSLSPKQHAFMDAETIAAVDRANQMQLGGRTDWKSHEIQAAAWVGKKGQAIAAEKGIPIEEALKEAQAGYRDALPSYTAYGTYDHIPGAATGHLPEVTAGSADVRNAYTNDPRSNYTNATGHDIFYTALNPRERPTVPTTSVFQSSVPGAAQEVGTGGAARPLVSLSGKSGQRTFDKPSEQMLRAAEGTRAYVGGQEMGAASMPFPDNRAGSLRSIMFNTPSGKMTPQQIADLSALGAKFDVPHVVHLGEQGYMTQFGEHGAEGAKDLRRFREAAEGGKNKPPELADELARIVPGAEPRRTDVRSISVDYAPEWQQGHGSGAVTRKLREIIDNPLILDKLDTPEIRANALGQLQRDAEIAARTGQPVRADLQNARDLIHKSGFRGLFAALDAGKIALPAVTLGLILPQVFGQQQAEPGPGS
jgi:hypothetical protein